MKIIDRSGRYYGVVTDHTGIARLRTVSADFDRKRGALVDVECNRMNCDPFRGDQLTRLLREMRCEGSKKVGLDHCATAGGLYGARRRRRKRRR